jgi:heat-inducible transcriptional repressor
MKRDGAPPAALPAAPSVEKGRAPGLPPGATTTIVQWNNDTANFQTMGTAKVAANGIRGTVNLSNSTDSLDGFLAKCSQLESPNGSTVTVNASGMSDAKLTVLSGRIGNVMNFVDPTEMAAVQKAARESRLKIPLLIGLDAVHGVSTYFPLPLGQAATFNPSLVEEAALWTGREARALGINWTFAPMVDMGRDPRWGRLLEGAGEDVHLSGIMAAARTRGYQAGGVAATVKHFVGYGGGEAGRDYNTAWIPAEQLHDLHLPPFRSAHDAGSLSVMAAFNSVNGTPATAHKGMLTDLLRRQWGFRGLVVSDFGSIPELIAHGIARDEAEAARKALAAGIDIDMMGFVYSRHLATEVRAGRVPTARGYRLFVDTMLTAQREQLPPASLAPDQPQRVIANAANLLSNLSNFVGVVMAPRRGSVFRHIEFLRLSEKRVLVIIVSPDGDVQNRVIFTDTDINQSQLIEASNYLNTHFVGMGIEQVRERLQREVDSLRSEIAALMQAAVQVSSEAMSQSQDEVVISGERNLLSVSDFSSDMGQLRRAFDLFEQKAQLMRLLDMSSQAEGVRIYIGGESHIVPFEELSVVSANYEVDGQVVGTLGVIGPTRMPYDRMIQIVVITA